MRKKIFFPHLLILANPSLIAFTVSEFRCIEPISDVSLETNLFARAIFLKDMSSVVVLMCIVLVKNLDSYVQDNTFAIGTDRVFRFTNPVTPFTE